MADHQFQAGSSWWSSSAVPCRPDDVVSLPAMPSFVSCSTVLCRSLDYCDEMTTSPSASVSNSSVTFQGHPSALTTAGIPMDHFPSHEWNLQGPFCSGARSEHNFHGLLQEDVVAISGVNIDMDGSSFSSTTNINPLRSHPMSHTFLEDHSNSFIINPLVSPSFASPYAFLHGLNLEQDGGSQTSFEEDRTIRLPEQQQQQQLQFSNETFFWNPIAASGTEHHALRPPPPPPPPLTLPLHNQTSSGGYNSSLLKTSSNSSMESRKSSEPSLKKTRIEAPSAIPTFKVRKEKLGDRITALQQLVSPFGKTDTASVLHEAIEYIKFLHNQVRVLSAPYLKNGHPAVPQMKDSEKSKECVVQNQELRSRGLCLVPISSTFAVANEIPTDFWTPTFMGGAFT